MFSPVVRTLTQNVKDPGSVLPVPEVKKGIEFVVFHFVISLTTGLWGILGQVTLVLSC